jgi:crotonobetainyl-CoA:carnitine CoA-transferase CaiB-like acyl-CoA transferase
MGDHRQLVARANKVGCDGSLAAAEVPASAVFDSTDLVANEHLRQRGAVLDLVHASQGTMTTVANPVRLSSVRGNHWLGYAAGSNVGTMTRVRG